MLLPRRLCSAYASPVASQTVQYISGDSGRKTITSNFNLNRAWSRLRCRVTEASESPTSGCSTDTLFRSPASFTSVTSTAVADSAGTSTGATPYDQGGRGFQPDGEYRQDQLQQHPQGRCVENRMARRSGWRAGISRSRYAWRPIHPQQRALRLVTARAATPSLIRKSVISAFNRRACMTMLFRQFPAIWPITTALTIPPTTFPTRWWAGDTAANLEIQWPPAISDCFIPDHFTVLAPTFTAGCNAGGYSCTWISRSRQG